MTSNDRQNLKRILASFDEAGLIALSNKGLVRRAAKDLQTGGLQVEEQENCVLVRGPGWTVTMPPEGPRQARDDTQATGVTRQILMAAMYLRDSWTFDSPNLAAEVTSANTEPEIDLADLERQLAEISVEQLQNWAGKEVSRAAWQLVESGARLEIVRRTDLTLRLVEHEVEVRVFPGAKTVNKLLDEAIATAPRAARKRWVATAVLAFLRTLGKCVAVPINQAPTESDGAPRDRSKLLASTQSLLESIVAVGLAHPSERSSERLLTTSISALALNMPRLSRMLRAAADELTSILDRDAQADSERLLELLAVAGALIHALQRPAGLSNTSLVGRHRTEYVPVGELTLTGVAAFPWRTGSGFEGVTVLFWDGANSSFRSWTYSRPMTMRGRTPLEQVYRLESPWSGGGAPERLARSRILLRNARLNGNGRLSASKETHAEMLGPTDPQALDFVGRSFRSWNDLSAYAPTPFPLGLAESNPLDRFVVLRPTTWGERFYDELNQRLVWPLFDDRSRPLLVSLPWIGVNESAIEFLETVKPDRDRLSAMLIRLQLTAAGPQFEPIALFGEGNPRGEMLFNPAFDFGRIESRQSHLLDRMRKKYGRDKLNATISPDDDLNGDLVPIGSWEHFPSGVGRPLANLSSRLLRLAETGTRRWDESNQQFVANLLQELSQTGIDVFDPAPKQSDEVALWLLKSVYLLRLYREAFLQSEFAPIAG